MHVLGQRASERGLPVPDAPSSRRKSDCLDHATHKRPGARSRTRVEVRELNAMISQLLDRQADEAEERSWK